MKTAKTLKPQQQQLLSFHKEEEQLSNAQIKHLIRLIRERYISPYKIMYMISQQEADLFKKRNQSCGCCSSSQITIPKDQMTKTQSFLCQTIQECLKIKKLDKILESLSDKFDNIVKSGEKANLKVDDQVQKFIIQKSLSQGFNLHIYQIVMEKLKKQVQSVSSNAMLWATPQTWYSKYPDTPLNFLSAQTLTNLTNQSKKFGFQSHFLQDYKDNLLKELKLLEKDGRFEELNWSKQHQKIRNDLKIMKYPQSFAYDGTEESYQKGQIIYPNLKKSLLTLRSIPFQLNQKLNAFCTLSENNQVSYFKNNLNYKLKDQSSICKYSTFCLIGSNSIKCKIISKQNGFLIYQKTLKSGQLVIIDSRSLHQIQFQGNGESIFLFRSWISTLQRKL